MPVRVEMKWSAMRKRMREPLEFSLPVCGKTASNARLLLSSIKCF